MKIAPLAPKKLCWLILPFACCVLQVADTKAETTITVDLSANPWEISPLIYGLNNWQKNEATEQIGYTLDRMGGNRTTSYNWENNFSNAGSDYLHHSDNLLVNTEDSEVQQETGLGVRLSVDYAQAGNRPSLVTLQLAGYVAADGGGTVSVEDSAPSERWKEVRVTKDGPLSIEPDKSDDYVYMDEQVNFLIETYGTSDEGGVFAYSMDNEPALWQHTHARIHPEQPTASEIISKNAEAAAMVKSLDSSALVFGPTLYGWGAYEDFQDAEDWAEFSSEYDWFIGAYLGEIRKLSELAGTRLVDVLDVHYYPEVAVVTGENDNGGDVYTRITDSESDDPELSEARLQAPRSLWDDSYVEESWVTQWETGGEPLEFFPKVFKSIEIHNPGTKLAITEYDFGGHQNFSGGLAQVDVLGIFGRDGVFAACFWGEVSDFIIPAFQLFRNYDGAGAKFGDLAIATSNPDAARFSSYAALNRDSGELQVILINKGELEEAVSLELLGFEGEIQSVTGYGFSEAIGPELSQLGGLTGTFESKIALSIPARSASIFSFAIAPEAELKSELRIENKPTAGSITVTIPTHLGHAYQLQESIDLDNWINSSDVFWGTGQDRVFTFEGLENERFWKVVPVDSGD